MERALPELDDRLDADLLDRALTETGRLGAEKLFARMAGGSDLLPVLVNAGFHPYANEVLYVSNTVPESGGQTLDLREFTGQIPVEVLGYTPFPSITDAPYFLALGPHDFYWFELQRPQPSA